MQYKSPVKIISSFLHENEDLRNISPGTIKKRILAEFELSDAITLNTPVGNFSKSDLLSYLDNFKTDENLEFHFTIASNPLLLDFLETNSPSGNLIFEDPAFKNQDFAKFLSPYLAHSLGYFFAACISDTNLPILRVNKAPVFILAEDEPVMIQMVHNAVDGILADLESVENELPSTHRLQQASKYFSSRLIRILNLLPRYYFSGLNDMYAKYGYKYIVAILKSKPKQVNYVGYCHKILERLLVLNVSSEIKSELVKLNFAFNRAKSGRRTKRTILIVLALVVLLKFCAALV